MFQVANKNSKLVIKYTLGQLFNFNYNHDCTNQLDTEGEWDACTCVAGWDVDW